MAFVVYLTTTEHCDWHELVGANFCFGYCCNMAIRLKENSKTIEQHIRRQLSWNQLLRMEKQTLHRVQTTLYESFICLSYPFCRVETIDGTAEATSDYVPLKSKISFKANECLREINIEIVDDDVWEPDEFFFAKLFLDAEDENSKHVVLGSTSINQITIINDDGEWVYVFFCETKHHLCWQNVDVKLLLL